jgi:PadR family transcriptional regulator, regulatory protein PadR
MPIQILQGPLDLMILRTLATMGPQHAYGIANRLQQVSEEALNLNQGTIYPALVRIEQHGWTRGSWGKTENGREAKYYTLTRAGLKALNEETERWRQMAGVIGATTPNVKNRTLRNLDHSFEAAKGRRGLKAPLRRRPAACQV